MANLMNSLMESASNTQAIQEAHFEWLPELEQSHEYRDLYKACKEADALLKSEGSSARAGWERFGIVACRILDIIANLDSIIALPFCFVIIGIPFYLFNRLKVWGFKAGQHELCLKYMQKCIRSFDKILEQPELEKADKEKIKAQKEKLQRLTDEFIKSEDYSG